MLEALSGPLPLSAVGLTTVLLSFMPVQMHEIQWDGN